MTKLDKTLLITSTHGNEGFSLPVVKDLAKRYDFDWIVGNPRAAKLNKRFIDCDLNRSAPGDPKSDLYEQRRAAYLVEKARPYRQVIDLHGSVSRCGLFVIVSDPCWENIELAKKIDLENVLLWPSLRPTGPLTQIIRPGIEIECGPKDDPAVAKQLGQVLTRFLENSPRRVKQRFFIVTGKLIGETDPQLRDFQLVKRNGRSFYPIMADNQYPGITCYQAQLLSDTLG